MPFDGARQRFKRAEAHRKAIGRIWNRFIQDDPYSASVYIDNDGAGRMWIAMEAPLPSKIPIIFGELLYQFRAALDSVVYEAAILKSGKNPPPREKDLFFPISATYAAFKETVGYQGPLPQKCRDIIELVQPYKAVGIAPELAAFSVNRNFWVLNDWAKKDRHRQLHVVGSYASNAAPLFRLPPGTRLTQLEIAGSTLLIGENKTQIARFRIEGYVRGMQVKANPNLLFDISVHEEPKPCADNDTLGVRLLTISLGVKMIIDKFEEVFL